MVEGQVEAARTELFHLCIERAVTVDQTDVIHKGLFARLRVAVELARVSELRAVHLAVAASFAAMDFA